MRLNVLCALRFQHTTLTSCGSCAVLPVSSVCFRWFNYVHAQIQKPPNAMAIVMNWNERPIVNVSSTYIWRCVNSFWYRQTNIGKCPVFQFSINIMKFIALANYICFGSISSRLSVAVHSSLFGFRKGGDRSMMSYILRRFITAKNMV